MYENGRQINRYKNKLIHKQKQKDLYRRKYGGGLIAASWKDYAAHCNENDSLEYWKTYYFSKVRKVARYVFNRKLRSEFRQDKSKQNYENMYAPQYGNYRKHGEYWWIIY